MRVPIVKTICLVVQSVYDFDPRVRRKAEALVAAGYSVDVLVLRPADGRKQYTLNGVNVYTVSLGKQRGSLVRYLFEYSAFFAWTLVKVPRLMRHRQYAVIDVNTLPDFLIFAPIVARWMGASLLLDMHEITPEFYMSKYGISDRSLIIRLLAWLEKISVRFADHVLTINEPILDLLVSRGLARSKATVIMNAVDEARFTPPAGAPRPAGAAERFVMMYHGTLTRTYGMDIAIEAFAIAHEHMPGAEIWILGSGPESGPLAEQAKECGLSAKVKLFGQVAAREIPGWLSQCDMGILPFRRDVFLDFAFPNKLPEFIVAGKVVAIPRLKAVQHYFSEDALVYFEPNSASALAEQMVRIYREESVRRRMVARAREEYAPIRWEVQKGRYLDLVGELAGVSRRAAEPARRAEVSLPGVRS